MATTHHNIDELESIRLAQHLEELETRLISEYTASSDVAEADIARVFEEATGHFDTASIHVFLPILIERRIRAGLERESATPPSSS